MDKVGENDNVSLDMTQVVSLLTIVMVFTGLSIQIARFGSHNSRGAYGRDKYTCVGKKEIGGGLMHERGILANHPGFSRTVLQIDVLSRSPGSKPKCPRNLVYM